MSNAHLHAEVDRERVTIDGAPGIQCANMKLRPATLKAAYAGFEKWAAFACRVRSGYRQRRSGGDPADAENRVKVAD
jgi:hypothetical protein